MPIVSKVIKAHYAQPSTGSYLIEAEGEAHVLSVSSSLSGAVARGVRSRDGLIAEVKTYTNELIETAQRQAQEIIFEATKQALALEQEGFRHGLEQGRQAGMNPLLQATERLHQLLDSAVVERQTLLRRAEADIVDLSLAVAREVVHHDISIHPEGVVAMVQAGLEQVSAATVATIYVHPDDLELVRSALENDLAFKGAPGHRLVAARDKDRGGCVIEADGARVDATIHSALSRVAATFARMSAERQTLPISSD